MAEHFRILFSFLILTVLLFCKAECFAQQEGRLLISTMGTDVDYRVSRTVKHLKDKEHLAQKGINTGEEILNFLEGDSILFWLNYSHGNNSRMFGKNPTKKISYYNEGLILFDETDAKPESRSLNNLQEKIDSGQISFDPNGLIVLHSCAMAAFHDETGLIFGQELANTTGARVLAGQHQTEPVIEDYDQLIYSNKLEFVVFTPGKDTARLIGDSLHLTNLMTKHLKSNGQYDFDDFEARPISTKRERINPDDWKFLPIKMPALINEKESFLLPKKEAKMNLNKKNPSDISKKLPAAN